MRLSVDEMVFMMLSACWFFNEPLKTATIGERKIDIQKARAVNAFCRTNFTGRRDDECIGAFETFAFYFAILSRTFNAKYIQFCKFGNLLKQLKCTSHS